MHRSRYFTAFCLFISLLCIQQQTRATGLQPPHGQQTDSVILFRFVPGKLMFYSPFKGNDRAIRLYEKFGFERFGVRPNAIHLKDGTRLRELLMVKVL